jgi:penicillin-binding protein-related factor A (putative recombinase)
MRILRSMSGGQFVAVYATEGPPDYVLLSDGHAIAAEAKDCLADRWQLNKLHAHQARRLTAWEAQGGLGVVLLRHQPSDTRWVLPWLRLGPVWARWHEAAEAGRELPRGSASISLPQLHDLGLPFCRIGGHLPVIVGQNSKKLW